MLLLFVVLNVAVIFVYFFKVFSLHFLFQISFAESLPFFPILIRCDTYFLLLTVFTHAAILFVCTYLRVYLLAGVFLLFTATPISLADRRH